MQWRMAQIRMLYVSALLAGLLASAGAADGAPIQGNVSQLSGTVVDTSGAVIAGANVQVLSANGTVERTTQSDTNGSFIFSGLAAGNYRLVVSNTGFETKEILVSVGTAGRRPRCASL